MPTKQDAIREDLSAQLVLSAIAVAAVGNGDANQLDQARDDLWGDVELALQDGDDQALADAMAELADGGELAALDHLQLIVETAAETACDADPDAAGSRVSALFVIPVLVTYDQGLAAAEPFLGRYSEIDALERSVEDRAASAASCEVTICDYLYHPYELTCLPYSDIARLTAFAHLAPDDGARVAALSHVARGWPAQAQSPIQPGTVGLALRYLVGAYSCLSDEESGVGFGTSLEWGSLAESLVTKMVSRAFPQVKSVLATPPRPFFDGLRSGEVAFADSALVGDIVAAVEQKGLELGQVDAYVAAHVAEDSDEMFLAVRVFDPATDTLVLEYLRNLDIIAPGERVAHQVERAGALLADLGLRKVFFLD